MKLEGEQVLLRVQLRNTDLHGWRSAAESLLERARGRSLAGATIQRGILGLDVDGRLLEGVPWSLVDHVPVLVELVDTAQRIGQFLVDLEEIVEEGVVTLERAHVLVYREKTAARTGRGAQVPPPVESLSTLPSAEEFPAMKLSEDGQLVRIFVGESDQWHGEPLFQAIVMQARKLGLAGATVLRGTMGFGANSRVHATSLLAISTDLPVVIEIVDRQDRIDLLLPFLDECVQEGLITIEKVRVLKYRSRDAGKRAK